MGYVLYICGMKNPFIYNGNGIELQEVATWYHSRPFDDGGVKAKYVIRGTRIADNERYIKVYSSFMEVLSKMSLSGIRMFVYVMDIIEQDKDIIILDRDIYCRYSGNSSNIYYRGIRELVRLGIIMKRGSGGSYWINPHVLFNGNRKVLVSK